MKELYENPKMYGYYYEKSESYKPDVFDLVLIDQSTDWVEMAERFQMKYKELRALNPWIRSYKFPNKNMQELEVKIKKRS